MLAKFHLIDVIGSLPLLTLPLLMLPLLILPLLTLELLPLAPRIGAGGVYNLASIRADTPTVVGLTDLCLMIWQYSGSSVPPSNFIHCIIAWYNGKNLTWIEA